MTGYGTAPHREAPPMPRAIPVPVRRVLWQRAQRGESTQALAEALGLRPRTVRSLCRRFRLEGAQAIPPSYHAPPPPPHAKPAGCVEAVCQTRRDHPSWGAGLILVVLLAQQPSALGPASAPPSAG